MRLNYPTPELQCMADLPAPNASQLGARICNGLSIMRACLETLTFECLEDRLDELQGEADQEEDHHMASRQTIACLLWRA
jgi:hypothetical protein